MNNEKEKIYKEISLSDGGKILLYDVMGKNRSVDVKNRNVVKVDAKGKEIWIIESSAALNEDAPYTNIWIDEDKHLIAGCWNGVDAKVNMEDGTIISEEFLK